jgi:hypothetical protein
MNPCPRALGDIRPTAAQQWFSDLGRGTVEEAVATALHNARTQEIVGKMWAEGAEPTYR